MQHVQTVRITTTAPVSYTPAFKVGARLKAGAAAATMTLYNNTTAAANEITKLGCAANEADETTAPLRAKSGIVKVVMTPNTALGYLYIY